MRKRKTNRHRNPERSKFPWKWVLIFGGAILLMGGMASGAGSSGSSVLSPVQQKLVQTAQEVVDSGFSDESCFYFVFEIFRRAGFGGSGRGSTKDLNFIWVSNKYSYPSIESSPNSEMTEEEVRSIVQPGDWAYIIGKYYKIPHSVFIMDIDKNTLTAKVANQKAAYKAGITEERNLIEEPVIHLMRVKDA